MKESKNKGRFKNKQGLFFVFARAIRGQDSCQRMAIVAFLSDALSATEGFVHCCEEENFRSLREDVKHL